jgi:beta-lactam-binding protein with PASTA domain
VTSYTTTTPGQVTLQTITSNGLVIVMVSSGAPQSVTPSVVYAVSNQATSSMQEAAWSTFWPMGLLLIAIASLMIWL